MKRYIRFPLLYLVFFSGFLATAQTRPAAYQLKGVVNVDTGTAVLLPTGDKEFDPNLQNQYQAKIKQGTFLFEGQMAYPVSYRLLMPNYISSEFILEARTQTVVCQIDSIRETPQLDNSSMREHTQFFQEYVRPLSKRRQVAFEAFLEQKAAITDKSRLDSLESAYAKQRSGLIQQQQAQFLAYTRQHPHSYVVLWELVKQVGEGYQPFFDTLYAAFSSTLKTTPTGRMLAQRLATSRATAIGQPFPPIRLLDMTSQAVSLSPSPRKKYTLVDFWFSRCGPCLVEFPKLKALYSTYQDRGFDILGISIDPPADVDLWKKTIQEKGLVWPHYLDVSGKVTVGTLSIKYFPSNFLLDAQGTIIRKNLSPLELEKFLSQNM